MSSQFASNGGLRSPRLQHCKKQLYIIIRLKRFAFKFGNGRNLEIFNATIIKIGGCTLTVKTFKLKN